MNRRQLREILVESGAKSANERTRRLFGAKHRQNQEIAFDLAIESCDLTWGDEYTEAETLKRLKAAARKRAKNGGYGNPLLMMILMGLCVELCKYLFKKWLENRAIVDALQDARK